MAILLDTRGGRGTLLRSHMALFRQDAARWVRPEQIASIDEVTPRVLAGMLLRHRPLRAMAWFRLGSLAKAAGVRGVPGWSQRRLSRLYGLELSVGSQVAGGLYVAHPAGTVISAESIGRDVTIIGSVTVGRRGTAEMPGIGDRVFVGAGARILGGVHVGDDAAIGANAVVLTDVPDGTTAVGVPARAAPSSPAAHIANGHGA
jgi:serine O-acetyltransferase